MCAHNVNLGMSFLLIRIFHNQPLHLTHGTIIAHKEDIVEVLEALLVSMAARLIQCRGPEILSVFNHLECQSITVPHVFLRCPRDGRV